MYLIKFLTAWIAFCLVAWPLSIFGLRLLRRPFALKPRSPLQVLRIIVVYTGVLCLLAYWAHLPEMTKEAKMSLALTAIIASIVLPIFGIWKFITGAIDAKIAEQTRTE